MKKIFLTGLACFFALFALEYFIHSHCLAGLYESTADLWRTKLDMKSKMIFMTIGQYLFAFAFVGTFSWRIRHSAGGVLTGVIYGLVVSALVGPLNILTWYTVLPIPGILAFYWLITLVFECVVMGVIAGSILPNNKKS